MLSNLKIFKITLTGEILIMTRKSLVPPLQWVSIKGYFFNYTPTVQYMNLKSERKRWFFPLKNLIKRWHPPFEIVHELGEARHLLLKFCRPAGPLVFNLNKLVCKHSVMVTGSVADPGCLTRIPIFSIPDPKFFSSRIPDPHHRI